MFNSCSQNSIEIFQCKDSLREMCHRVKNNNLANRYFSANTTDSDFSGGDNFMSCFCYTCYTLKAPLNKTSPLKAEWCLKSCISLKFSTILLINCHQRAEDKVLIILFYFVKNLWRL